MIACRLHPVQTDFICRCRLCAIVIVGAVIRTLVLTILRGGIENSLKIIAVELRARRRDGCTADFDPLVIPSPAEHIDRAIEDDIVALFVNSMLADIVTNVIVSIDGGVHRLDL